MTTDEGRVWGEESQMSGGNYFCPLKCNGNPGRQTSSKSRGLWFKGESGDRIGGPSIRPSEVYVCLITLKRLDCTAGSGFSKYGQLQYWAFPQEELKSSCSTWCLARSWTTIWFHKNATAIYKWFGKIYKWDSIKVHVVTNALFMKCDCEKEGVP